MAEAMATDDVVPELATATPDCCCRICLEAEDAEAGRLFAPCLCTGTMRLVHERCLERWRAEASNRRSYYRCDACLYEYRIRRVWIGALLLSPAFAHGLTAAVFLAGTASAGATSRWALRRSGLCASLRGRGRSPRRCRVDAWAYDACWRIAVHSRGEYTARALGEAHAELHRLHAVTVAPAQVFASGTLVLGAGGFVLYFRRRLRDCRRGDVARLALWIYALGLDNLNREATVIGLAVVIRELYVAIRPLAKQAAQRLGERVLEVSA